mmetsp:Transcript_6268/g.25159  ORF Transcript_6268/g.25159 Transcript_6268/m.25159 type:complete len:343 (-) Transcript_6268:1579-2607(-)
MASRSATLSTCSRKASALSSWADERVYTGTPSTFSINPSADGDFCSEAPASSALPLPLLTRATSSEAGSGAMHSSPTVSDPLQRYAAVSSARRVTTGGTLVGLPLSSTAAAIIELLPNMPVAAAFLLTGSLGRRTASKAADAASMTALSASEAPTGAVSSGLNMSASFHTICLATSAFEDRYRSKRCSWVLPPGRGVAMRSKDSTLAKAFSPRRTGIVSVSTPSPAVLLPRLGSEPVARPGGPGTREDVPRTPPGIGALQRPRPRPSCVAGGAAWFLRAAASAARLRAASASARKLGGRLAMKESSAVRNTSSRSSRGKDATMLALSGCAGREGGARAAALL